MKQILRTELPTVSATCPRKRGLLCSAETRAAGIQGMEPEEGWKQVLQFMLGGGGAALMER